MGKIVEPEFRKELYKNLIDAGYTKEEAQKIVGVKYYEDLKGQLVVGIEKLLNDVKEDKYNEITFEEKPFKDIVSELVKLKELIQ